MGKNIDVFVEDKKVVVDFIEKHKCFELAVEDNKKAIEFADGLEIAITDLEENGVGNTKKKKGIFSDEKLKAVYANFDIENSTEKWPHKCKLSSESETAEFAAEMSLAIFGKTPDTSIET